MATILYNPLPALVPIALISAVLVITRPIILFYVFFFLLPFSVEIYLPNGLGTDLPSEPIMLLLTGICIVLFFKNIKRIDKQTFVHPITLVLIFHIFWIALTSLYSTNMTFSFKFLLAKFWYVLPFYFLPLILLKSFDQFRNVFKFLSIGLFISIAYVMARHAGVGFSFDGINDAVKPIYRNHVNYGIMLISFLPFMWFLYKSSQSFKWIKTLGIVILLIAIYLTYTRAAQLAVVLSIGIYFVIKWRLAKIAVLASLAVIIMLISFLAINNNYLDMAPDYNKAVEHKKFDNLMEATYKMEDISTVERFYRWVAGFYMIKEKPMTGFGPATFYSEYKSHTVTSYKTYVSDNPEKSGIHNYYLMTAVEQGIPGLIIFLLLALLPIFYGEMAYHHTQDSSKKALIMAAIICFALIDIVILINDLLEADKVGPFFFLSAAIITFFYVESKKAVKEAE
ncbi:MAG: O-antigen ligase family protein [Saprospiraceae bacterium]|nr:O-antigen ligase family protein [Bacteroidia bacterium]NNL91323.1 O-antigen ligase family protein [Saprospiraceae bacterium]